MCNQLGELGDTQSGGSNRELDRVTGNGQWKYASNCLLPIEDESFLGKVRAKLAEGS